MDQFPSDVAPLQKPLWAIQLEDSCFKDLLTFWQWPFVNINAEVPGIILDSAALAGSRVIFFATRINAPLVRSLTSPRKKLFVLLRLVSPLCSFVFNAITRMLLYTLA